MKGNQFTAIAASFLGAAPLFMPFIPAPYAAGVTILLQAANALYHLYVPVPTTPATK